ncbi:MAG: hypothetical protein K9G30_08785, partial [Parvibaculum sp.]|nr:hypothetical protein [Parvibaculum sp.]
MGRIVLAFILAVIVTTVLGSIAHTQFILAGLADLSVAIPLSERLSMTVHDIAGMGPQYGVVIAIGLLMALAAAALVFRIVGTRRTLIYGVAGAVALAVALTAMSMA